MNKSIYDSKIIILDIDFLEISKYNLDDTLYTKKLLLELAANQNLVFITDNDFNCAIKVIDSLGIKSGFLISNSGSSITNIANRKVILETLMDKDICLAIANKCIWSNLNFSLHTFSGTHPYLMINNWITKKYKSDLSHLFNHAERELKTSEDVQRCIEGDGVRSMEIYFLEMDDDIRRKNMREKIMDTATFDTINFVINSCVLHVIPSILSKLQVLEILAKRMEWDLKNNGLYCGIGQCTTDICQNVYFPAVTRESISKDDHKPFHENTGIEEIPIGSVSWINWFYKNSHLWSGEEEKLKQALPRNKNIRIDAQSLENFRNGTTKYLVFKQDGDGKITKRLFSRKQYKKTQEQDRNIQIGFWKNQISSVIKLLEK